MKFTMTKIAALAAMAFASTGAHAVLGSTNTLSIEGDAVSYFGGPAEYETSWASFWWVPSNGLLADSFFTMGGSKTPSTIDTQFAYLYNGEALTLTGALQSNIATFTYYSAPGSIKTTNIGISILSASGDTATVDMSGLTWTWNTEPDISMGTGAWSSGYTNGVGNITCTTGSGCAVGSAYTLRYTATVPADSLSVYHDTQFYLELHGTVGAVPEPETYAMLLAGLGVLVFAARRRLAHR